MALIASNFVFFIAAIIIVVRLLNHEVLKRLAFVGLRAWAVQFSAVEAHQVVAAYSGPDPEAKQAAALLALQPSKQRTFRHPQLPWMLPTLTHSWWAALGLDEGRWLNLPELLSLMNLAALLAVAYALVGAYECLEGAPTPSYHVTLLAATALASALGLLAVPLVRGPRLELQLALCLGACVAALSGLGYALLFAATGEGARAIPWVDLGAPLGEGVTRSVGLAGGAAVGAGVAAFMLAVGTLLAMPALRTARYFSQLMAAAEAGRSRLGKVSARYGMYAPALVAALWLRPLITVTAGDAVQCAGAVGWGGGVSRDCRASQLGAGSAGGEALAGLLPLWVIEMLPGEGWHAYAAALGARYWISESSWLRWRCAAVVVAACGSMLLMWRKMLQGHLDTAWKDAARVLHGAGERARAGLPPKKCTSPHPPGYVCKRPAPECALEEQRLRAIVTLAQAALQLLAVPVVMGSLAVLATRGTGLGGLGACNTARRAAEGVAEWAWGARAGAAAGAPAAAAAAAAAKGADTLSWAIKTGGETLFGKEFESVLQDTHREALATALSPALWRPVLSYVLFSTLITWWVLGELGLMYWRVFTSADDKEEEEEGKEKEAVVAAPEAAGKEAGRADKGPVARKAAGGGAAAAAKAAEAAGAAAAAAAASALAASEDVD